MEETSYQISVLQRRREKDAYLEIWWTFLEFAGKETSPAAKSESLRNNFLKFEDECEFYELIIKNNFGMTWKSEMGRR